MSEQQRKAYGRPVSLPDFTAKNLGDSIGKSISAGKEHLSAAADLGKGYSEAQQDILEGIMSRIPAWTS